jgi:hypothetical protein
MPTPSSSRQSSAISRISGYRFRDGDPDSARTSTTTTTSIGPAEYAADPLASPLRRGYQASIFATGRPGMGERRPRCPQRRAVGGLSGHLPAGPNSRKGSRPCENVRERRNRRIVFSIALFGQPPSELLVLRLKKSRRLSTRKSNAEFSHSLGRKATDAIVHNSELCKEISLLIQKGISFA